MSRSWPETIIDRMREMRAQGATALQIGNEIGRTRNAVIGQCRRLGIPTLNGPSMRADIDKPQKALKTKAETPVVYTPPPPPRFDTPHEPVAMVELRYLGQCKWSVADGLFCGREAETVWCDAHKRVVFQPQKRAS